jgi:hypothetical protein
LAHDTDRQPQLRHQTFGRGQAEFDQPALSAQGEVFGVALSYYEGEYNGMNYQSIHPNLYRVTYSWVNPSTHRVVETTTTQTAYDEYGARERITRRSDVRGDIKVEFIMSLTKKEKK